MSDFNQAIKNRLRYDRDSGSLFWRDGPRAGEEAGGIGGHGYRHVNFSGRMMLTHRIAWFLVYGAWPEYMIDHIDGDKLNNRFHNLRDIPMRGNQQNVGKRKDNKTGFIGVTPHFRKWKAVIRHCGDPIYLGLYDTAEDAAASYELAKFALHEYQSTERGVSHV